MAPEANHAKLKRVRFGPFQFNPATGELERRGIPIPLQNTPARLLAELVAKEGTLCSREELCAVLWPADVYVDFENNLNNAVARLRQALGDAGSAYVETIPRRGYRFNGEIARESPAAPVVNAVREALSKGRHFRNRITVRDLWRAADWFQHALVAETESAAAYAGLSDVYVLLGDDVLGALPATDALPKAEAAARRALEIDPHCAAAYTTLAMVDWRLYWDWTGAEERFQRAIALDPESASTWQYFSWLLQASAQPERSRDAMLRALALDPASPFVSTNVGWMLYLDRRYTEALAHLRETVDLDENYALVRLPLGYALQQAGQLHEAIAHFRTGLALSGGAYYRAALGQALAQAGFHKEASAMLFGPAISQYNRAMIHAALGQEQDTLRCLESAVVEHSSAVTYLQVDPLFDGVRGNGRYKRIAECLGLA